MSTAFDPKSSGEQELPVREGQGDKSSIRSDNEGRDAGNSETYPQPSEKDKREKQQDEYDNKAKDQRNKTT